MKKIGKNNIKRLILSGVLILLAVALELSENFLPHGSVGSFFVKLFLMVCIGATCYFIVILDMLDN